MKALGIEIKQFWNDPNFEFPKGEVEWEIDGSDIDEIEELDDDVKYELKELGWFNYIDCDSSITFESAFKLWKKQQTTTTIVIEVEKSKLDGIMLFLKDSKIKVVK